AASSTAGRPWCGRWPANTKRQQDRPGHEAEPGQPPAAAEARWVEPGRPPAGAEARWVEPGRPPASAEARWVEPGGAPAAAEARRAASLMGLPPTAPVDRWISGGRAPAWLGDCWGGRAGGWLSDVCCCGRAGRRVEERRRRGWRTR